MCRIWKTNVIDKTLSEPSAPPPKRPGSNGASSDKWGPKVIALGFCILPSLLLRAQRRLCLSPTQLSGPLLLAGLRRDAGRSPRPTTARPSWSLLRGGAAAHGLRAAKIGSKG